MAKVCHINCNIYIFNMFRVSNMTKVCHINCNIYIFNVFILSHMAKVCHIYIESHNASTICNIKLDTN
jgi:hypothetical protein